MHPISELLCRTYSELHKNGQVSFPLRESHKHALDSVVKTVNANYFGIERFPTPRDKAVAYLCLLIKNHPLTDGNKRLALLWFDVYCQVSGLVPREPDFGYDALVVAIEQAPLKMETLFAFVNRLLFGKSP
ncbi:MAG: Fic family protein [Patescibacteria group bacterium]|nr:Fic family protein [Patescibacteria group bacterium]